MEHHHLKEKILKHLLKVLANKKYVSKSQYEQINLFLVNYKFSIKILK